MIQTPRSSQAQSDLGLYLTLAALWVVPGLVLALATVLAGGAPHTYVVDWPYDAIRSVAQSHGRVLPWQWVGAATVRSVLVFWTVVVWVTMLGLAGVVVVVVVLGGGIPALFPFLWQPPDRSRWASTRALSRAGLLTTGPDGRRLVLGRHLGHWVAVRAGTSVLTLGAPGSGKSAGLCIPTIGEWAGSVVAVSERTDLIETTAGLRQEQGRVDVLDASGRSGLATCTWSSGLVHLSFDEAVALVANVLGSRDPAPDEPTRELVTCVLYAAANRGVGVSGAVEWLDDVTGATLVDALLLVGDRDPRATSWATRIMELDRDARAATFSAARQLVRAHFEQAAPDVSMRAFQPTEFLTGSTNTLYVLIGGGPPASNTVESLLDTLIREAEQRRPQRSLLVVLDGCAAVASMRNVADHLEGRSESIAVLAALGDLDECGARTGWDMSALLERARTILLLGGSGETSPAELMHRLVRRQLVPRRRGRARANWDEARPDLLPPEAARQLGHGRALLVHERTAPAVLWMRNCYEDVDLQQRLREHPFVRGVTHIDRAS